jgi:hypothetical protein
MSTMAELLPRETSSDDRTKLLPALEPLKARPAAVSRRTKPLAR